MSHRSLGPLGSTYLPTRTSERPRSGAPPWTSSRDLSEQHLWVAVVDRVVCAWVAARPLDGDGESGELLLADHPAELSLGFERARGDPAQAQVTV